MDNDHQAGPDLEIVGKLCAVLDSTNAGEAEAAFRKLVLLAAKHGSRLCDVIAMAFGHGDGAEVTALQEQLQQQRAQHAAEPIRSMAQSAAPFASAPASGLSCFSSSPVLPALPG